MLITAGNPKDLYTSNVLVLTMLFHFSEYAASGCLYDHLANNKLNFDQILQWSTEIALGKQKFILIHLYTTQNHIGGIDQLPNFLKHVSTSMGYVIAQQVAC